MSTTPSQVFSTVGLAYLLFLAGLEIDFERLRGRVLRLALVGFALSIAIAVLVGLLLKAGGLVSEPLFVAIVSSATSLGFAGAGPQGRRRDRGRPSGSS